jgi:DNA-binding LacI/PurR family transcriptional regulator
MLGKQATMRRAVNSTEVARRAGVSRTTVSFVLNGSEDSARIPLATRERVLRAAEEMGYSPNHMARVLISGRSFLIGLFSTRVHPAFYSRSIAAFQAALRGGGYDLRIQETAGWTVQQWKEAANDRWPLDGAILLEAVSALPNLTAGNHNHFPIVNVGADVSESVDHVRIDLYTGTRQAIQHLQERGRTRIAYLSPDQHRTTPRCQAYLDAMEDTGGEVRLIISRYRWEDSIRDGAYHAVTEYVRDGGDMDAIACFNDEHTIGALVALRNRGIRVPQDVALAGCDDIEDVRYHDPPLSTLQFPFDEAARISWDLLRRRIEEPDLPLQSVTLSAPLIVRQSS